MNWSAATAWQAANVEPLITTDYVIDETLTLLRARRETMRAIRLGRQLFGGSLGTIHHVTPAEVAAAWDVFRMFSDKEWSFTDCTSKGGHGDPGHHDRLQL